MSRKRRFFHIFITLVFLALGVVGFGALRASKNKLEKHRPPSPLPVVKAIKISTGPQSVMIQGEGTVRPLQQIDLVPQVGGKVVYVSPSLVNGGDFRQDSILLRIDPVDYNLTVTLAKAKVKDAESRLKLAMEEAAAAQEEWRLLHSGSPKGKREPPPLVAKEPQLMAAQARLEAERAGLKKALLNLERTELKAPFDGRVSQENVDIGQYVSAAKSLGIIYSIQAAEIVLPLENEDLSWFHVPGFTAGNGPGAKAVVRAPIAGQERTWDGQVVRTEGILDARTRTINVVVKVEKPYATKPPLAAGLFVTVDIHGRILPDAAVIPRAALREGEVVWVVDDYNVLHFRKVDVARIQGDNVVVKSGINDGEMVVISPHKVVTDRMSVRIILVNGGNHS
jgi:RND family efflux transporter MFP subunit